MFADLHCDTLYKCYVNKTDLNDNSLHINLDYARQMRPYIQTFAHFIPENTPDKFDFFCRMLENSISLIESCDELMLYREKSDIEQSEKENKILAVLSVEGGNFFCDNKEQSLKIIKYLEQNHIKFLSLCYNHGSDLCSGAQNETDYGLTGLGFDVAYNLCEHGIALDVSHLGAKSTMDILESDLVSLATHSNCYVLCQHPRNISDDAISRLIDNKSLVGINLYSPFLNSRERAGISDIYKHIQHIHMLGGDEIIAFGADFDGCDDLPTEIEGLIDIKKLDISQEITYNNVKRFLLNSI